MKTRNLLIVLTGLILAVNFAFAGNRPGAVTFTLSEAYYIFAQKRHLDNIGMPNAALAYNFNENWAAEFNMGLVNTNQKQFNQSGVHGFLYTLDGLYRFTPRGRWEPYVSAGIGMLGLTPNGNDSEYQGNVNAGFGMQYFIDRSIAFRGEARDIYTMIGGKNDVMLNFGISFLMGGEAAQPVQGYKGDK